jgi:hypothetical protein
MARDPRPASVLAAGLVGLLASGGYAATWYWVVERPVCEETGMFACIGPGVLMYVVGLPVTYVLWSLGLRAVRAPLPWLAPLATLLVLVVVVPLAEPLEPPMWVWPFVAGFVCVLWARIPRPSSNLPSP